MGLSKGPSNAGSSGLAPSTSVLTTTHDESSLAVSGVFSRRNPKSRFPPCAPPKQAARPRVAGRCCGAKAVARPWRAHPHRQRMVRLPPAGAVGVARLGTPGATAGAAGHPEREPRRGNGKSVTTLPATRPGRLDCARVRPGSGRSFGPHSISQLSASHCDRVWS